MMSDSEFLSGVYEKAEKITSDSMLDLNLNHKEQYQPIRTTARYVKYTGMAAGFLLLISSAIYLNNVTEKGNQVRNTPVPRDIKMVNYSEQLIEQASDIIAVEANVIGGEVKLNITEEFKNSGNDLKNINVLDPNIIDLEEGQLAIVFIRSDSMNTQVIDVFLWDEDKSIYENQYEETITSEALYNLENK